MHTKWNCKSFAIALHIQTRTTLEKTNTIQINKKIDVHLMLIVVFVLLPNAGDSIRGNFVYMLHVCFENCTKLLAIAVSIDFRFSILKILNQILLLLLLFVLICMLVVVDGGRRRWWFPHYACFFIFSFLRFYLLLLLLEKSKTLSTNRQR